MFQFPWFAPQIAVYGLQPYGLPHSEIFGSNLVSISLPFREGAGVGSSLPLTALKGKPNHIAVVKALIEMVNGLHQAEDCMFGPEAAEWY